MRAAHIDMINVAQAMMRCIGATAIRRRVVQIEALIKTRAAQ
jgi:hypothetical protein